MNPIYVALDTPDVNAAVAFARSVRQLAGGVKLGLEFFAANGPSGVQAVTAQGLPVFLDLKLHDIPNTVAKAVQALAPLAPSVLTVHAAGGRAMLEAAKAAAPAKTNVVAVTVLTSLDQSDLEDCGLAGEPADQVARLAALARASGLDGIVCSGAEVAAMRTAWPDGFFVVPGLRPAGEAATDQKRVVTPKSARDDGASILVIGRPITAAVNPAESLRAIAASL